ncbi:hypothetical protein Ahy_B02g059327 isoform D [Arachis hypogaea]|uniref:Disease resistance RPP13-like protein n=1 Tax=Arachis hypogaea TaxID=3818 RepID=A0A445AGF6_ARAHY|nr:hypothetical protein Ahy_B02g059327 isoform D [Arachis hypogaea]
MAGAVIGGAFLSGFINVVFDRFLSVEAANLVLGEKLGPDLVERLQTALLEAEALVLDAEQKQLGNEPVRKWLHSLRDAVYKADDLLDSVFTKAATRKEVPVSTFLPRFIMNYKDREMIIEIKRVVRRIEDLEKCKESLGLEKIPTRSSSSWRTPSTSLVRENVYGREDDQVALIKMLYDNNQHQLSVISVVGIGGVGKTTLAQCVYNNAELMKRFDLKAWICVSENFDIVEITKNVIKEISRDASCLENFNSLQLALKGLLSKKKFFIVLDDVWSNDGHEWSNFIIPFQYGAMGSTIFITTRRENVGSIVQNYRPYFLNGLSDEYCWSVFADNASFPKISNGSSELEGIGRKIVKKCDGLPLAAETLGRLLRTKHDVKEWSKILMSNIWGFSVTDSKIIPALFISYFHLPAYLKRCFVYCSLYPKGNQFDKDELVLLWMAEDLLPPAKRGETLVEIGRECFDDLASKLFFKQVQDNGGYFVMHDLLHDLAKFLAGDFFCCLEEHGEEEEIRTMTHHLSYRSLRHTMPKYFCSIDKAKSLRTKMSHHNLLPPSFGMESAARDVLSKFKYLRVLSFHKLDVLPDLIGELIHLRYLDLSWTHIRVLPESLCNLYNLQTLKLQNCLNLTMLPNGMHNLVKLQHLDIRRTPLEEMPREMGKLKYLQHLNCFVVGKQEDNGIKELGGLSNLHEALEILKLENVTSSSEAMAARISDKIHIDELSLRWSLDGDVVSNTQVERNILENLHPHYGLKKLIIEGYRGTMFPNWIGHCLYHNITSVSLVSCNNCCMLPSLGQLQSLRSLDIEGFGQLDSIGIEFYKNRDNDSLCIAPFPSLEFLKFCNMPCLEVWHSFDSYAFPQLKKLQLQNCPLLKERLDITGCQRFVSPLSGVLEIHTLHIYETTEGSQELLFDMKNLLIRGCHPEVESMSKAMSINHLAFLKVMHIFNYSSAVALPSNHFPKSLARLRIDNCSKVEFPKQQQQQYDLVELVIENSCDSLTSFSLELFPKLELLQIRKCASMESLSMSLSQHTALHRLVISKCPNFVSFPGEGLAMPNLAYFVVMKCYKLKSLPCHMNVLLPSLEFLNIYGCPGIQAFPEGGLPPNLKKLYVGGCDMQLSSLSSMGNFEALTRLNIEGAGCDSIKSFPQVGSLPRLPSLNRLGLHHFHNLETLECNELLHLNFLQQLIIEECPKLENMTGKKLPSSLLQLQIDYCPLLLQLCEMKDPKVWAKISHIPIIEVNGKQIL